MSMTDWTTIDLARRTIGEGLTQLVDEAIGSDDPAEVARALAALRDLKADAATVFADVEQHLLACMGERTLEVPGLGLFESKRKTKRTGWDHDALVKDVIARTDGCAISGLPDAEETAAALRECISFGAGKATGLRARGLQPDEYCSETPDGYSVQLPPRDHDRDLA